MSCHRPCGCRCGVTGDLFDRALVTETTLDLRLADLLEHSGTEWLTPRGLDGLNPRGSFRQAHGVYVLWKQEGYCPEHEREHMTAQYAGQGRVPDRVYNHWLCKRIDAELAVYATTWYGPTRLAKYLEQLLLDIYDFPLNVAENRGDRRLCAHPVAAGWN
jgi:hypothetical protein